MTIQRVLGVKVVHWNPLRGTTPRPLRALGLGERVKNFGDILGPAIVERSVRMATSGKTAVTRATHRSGPRLLSIGSIMHMAETDDVVWGTGVNGKVSDSAYSFEDLDVRAVRGPLTRQWLAQRGVDAPAIYGDPALLAPSLFPEFTELARNKQHRLTIVPNFHDHQLLGDVPGAIDPRGKFQDIIARIVQSEQIIASSLHGVILAEAFGIPAIAMKSSTEPAFKYLDYFEGTGRNEVSVAEDLHDAERLLKSSHSRENALSSWSPDPLQAAFPKDLWKQAT